VADQTPFSFIQPVRLRQQLELISQSDVSSQGRQQLGSVSVALRVRVLHCSPDAATIVPVSSACTGAFANPAIPAMADSRWVVVSDRVA
jgi:hypothetical protein